MDAEFALESVNQQAAKNGCMQLLCFNVRSFIGVICWCSNLETMKVCYGKSEVGR